MAEGSEENKIYSSDLYSTYKSFYETVSQYLNVLMTRKDYVKTT